jgi:hypothetical protein
MAECFELVSEFLLGSEPGICEAIGINSLIQWIHA